MQKAAFDADAISRLAELLASVSSKDAEEEETPPLGVPGIGSVAKRKEKIKEVKLLFVCLISRCSYVHHLELPYCYCSCYAFEGRMSYTSY